MDPSASSWKLITGGLLVNGLGASRSENDRWIGHGRHSLPNQFYLELDAMVDAGLTPMSVILAATRDAAIALGIR